MPSIGPAIMQEQYWADGLGGYYLSAADTGDIIIRTLSARDDATPNANAVMLSNLSRAAYDHRRMPSIATRAEALRKALVGEALRAGEPAYGLLQRAGRSSAAAACGADPRRR